MTPQGGPETPVVDSAHDEQQSIDFSAPAPSQRRGERYDLYGGKPPYQAGSDTSEDAADAIEPDAATVRGIVLEAIRSAGRNGLTDEEMQIALEMNPNTQRPRRRELVMKGLVADSGHRRPTSTGRNATVWATASLHPIDRGPHEPSNKRLAKAEARIVALEAELAEERAKRRHWEKCYDDEEESHNWTSGMLADVTDALFDDDHRAANHGYDGVLERALALGKAAGKR